MSDHKLRFRQIHLDFHTSPCIPAIGTKFDKAQWQEALQECHVDSITCFSKCHHGWSYHPTKVGKMHPHLDFDLLRAQFDSAKEIDVNVPVYISAGLDSVMAEEHPEWRPVVITDGPIGTGTNVFQAGFKLMCFNSPYLEYLCEQAIEAVRLFPDCDGIFSDIIFQTECGCVNCIKWMKNNGLNPESKEDRQISAKAALERYYQMFTDACRIDNPNMPVFHNSGHIAKGNRDILKYFSHLELESLPTGGWGYDHFPMSAKYVANLGLDYLGMTGKFHTTWGEFGGYKHPNALRYECAAMIANGSKCSVGDQLHPSGEMNMSTYKIIGAAYKEVEEKEPWCVDVATVSDVAVLSSESETSPETRDSDAGVGRVLLESHILFDLIDRQMGFDRYKMLILPDVIEIDTELKAKIDAYLAKGGKLMLTGKSGLAKDGSGFAFDIGGKWEGESQFQPDYISPGSVLAPSFVENPLVMYMKSEQVKATTGEVLAEVCQPYFNRTWEHFCSHQHAPAAEVTPYAGAIRKGSIIYLAHPVFSIYGALGAVAYKEYAVNAIKLMLGEDETLKTNMSSIGRVTLMDQAKDNRYVLHLLYANKMARGSQVNLSPEGYVMDSKVVEVIEDLDPVHNVEVSLKTSKPVKSATLEPQGQPIGLTQDGNRITIKIDEFICHQMVALNY